MVKIAENYFIGGSSTFRWCHLPRFHDTRPFWSLF